MSTEHPKFLPRIPELDFSSGTRFLTDFSREAQKHLATARSALLILEISPTDAQSLENVFKAFHMIKGSADFLKLKDIHCLAHESAMMMGMVRNGQFTGFEGSITSLAAQAVDSLRKFLELLDEQIANKGEFESPYPNVGKLIAAIRDVTSEKSADPGSQRVIIKAIPAIAFEPDMSSCTRMEEKLRSDSGDLNIDKAMLQKLISDFKETSRELKGAQSKLLERQRELVKERELASKVTRQAQTEAKTKSDYLATMAHEIRTLINAILGFSELLKEGVLTAKQKEQVETVVLSGNMLLKIVNDILDFSKVEAGKLKLEKISFNLRGIIEEVFKIIRTRLIRKPINLFFDVHNDIQDHFIGDPVRLKQIFINLLDNAIKFTKAGEVSLSVTMDGQQPPLVGQSQLRFVVSDTGIGLSEESKLCVFESFTQANAATTRLYGGSGLGLTLCKNFVEKMKGRMWVESELGEGSRFIFTIPMQESQKGFPVSSQAVSPLSAFCGTEIMVVDGHENSFRTLDALCRENQLKIFPAIQGAPQALEFLAQRNAENASLPAIVFIDVMLPAKEGFMLAYKIREQPAYKGIKLVSVSADPKIDLSGDFKQAGFDALLIKPIIKDEVVEVILGILGDTKATRRVISREILGKISCEGVRVLVAEDSIPNQELLKAHFASLGCICDYASNGQEAVDKLRDQSYDICFMDLQMPVMGGFQAAKIIREELRLTLPIVALTAADIQEEKEKCLKIGMSDYLSKPFGLEELKEKIIRCTKM